MRAQLTCTCKGYPFIHRLGGGRCLDDGSGQFCGECGEPCEVTDVNFGIGPYEFHGRAGNDRNVRTVSACCEAPIYTDASLSHELND
jgi:hypothetical protein